MMELGGHDGPSWEKEAGRAGLPVSPGEHPAELCPGPTVTAKGSTGVTVLP